MALGSMAEVYDAEMEGLAKAAELFREWVDSQELDASFSTVYFFADNTGALQRIYKGTPGYDQNCSLRFRDAVHHVLDSRRASSIEIEWVPGHHGIQGNDTADKLAKKGSADAPANANFMTAAFAGNSRKRVYEQRWKEHWQSDSTIDPMPHRSRTYWILLRLHVH
jgi:ribonuclease HI